MATKKPSTAVAKAKVALPANIQEQMDKDMALFQARLAAPTGSRIAVTQDRKFRSPDGSKFDTIQGVIVDFIAKKTFYTTDFDKDNIVPPDCYSMGFCSHDELVMADDSPDPQIDEGEACSTCPKNKFGSKGKGKACGDAYILALLPPDADEGTPLMTLSLSATAVKPFSKYISDLQKTGKPPYFFITEFWMDETVDYSSVRAGKPEIADNGLIALAISRKEDAAKLLAVRPNFDAPTEVPVTPPPKGKAAAKPAVRKAR